MPTTKQVIGKFPKSEFYVTVVEWPGTITDLSVRRWLSTRSNLSISQLLQPSKVEDVGDFWESLATFGDSFRIITPWLVLLSPTTSNATCLSKGKEPGA